MVRPVGVVPDVAWQGREKINSVIFEVKDEADKSTGYRKAKSGGGAF